MNARSSRFAQMARQHDEARQWAQELRRQAIVDFWASFDAAAAAGWRRVAGALRTASLRLRRPHAPRRGRESLQMSKA